MNVAQNEDIWLLISGEKGNIVTYLCLHLHLTDAFIQSDLQCHSGYTFFISRCVPWELNPQPFALLTQCSTTEPQEHNTYSHKGSTN